MYYLIKWSSDLFLRCEKCIRTIKTQLDNEVYMATDEFQKWKKKLTALYKKRLIFALYFYFVFIAAGMKYDLTSVALQKN